MAPCLNPHNASSRAPCPDPPQSVNSSPAPLASPSSQQLQHPASIYRVRPSRFKSATGAATPGSTTPGHSTPRFGSPPRTPRYPSSSCAGDATTTPMYTAHNTAPASACSEHTPHSRTTSLASLPSPPHSQRHSLHSPFMDMVPPTPFQQLQRQDSSRCRDSPTTSTSRSHSLPHSLSHGPYHPVLSPATSVHNYPSPATPSSPFTLPHPSLACSPAPAAPPPPRPPGPLHLSLLLLARAMLIAYYSAALFADLEAWHSRHAMHRLRMQRQPLTHTHLTHTTHAADDDGNDATWRLSRLVSALGELLYGALGPGPHVALLHAAVAAPCLAALAAGRWVPEAAGLLAGRLLLELLTGHWRGLL